jgi:TetR/AcrR family transcriptional repressor of nem operon
MGRSSRADAERHHRELVEAAARLFRERDLGAVSVPDVMHEIGMTRGGFYKHFESKDALVAAAVEQAFTEHLARLERLAAEQGHDPDATRVAFVEFCLSYAHRDDPGHGCPSALASGISRSEIDGAPRTAFVDGLRALVTALSKCTDTEAEQTLCDFAFLVGTLLLARATAGDALSDEFLAAARQRLT